MNFLRRSQAPLPPLVPRLLPPPAPPAPAPPELVVRFDGELSDEAIARFREQFRAAARDTPGPPAEPAWVVVLTTCDGCTALSHASLMTWQDAWHEAAEWRRRRYQADVREVR
jgi:hypothetical protein